MIVVVGGEKGGTGKTTVATNLAQMRTSRGKDVLLVDTDKQASSSLWASNREEEGVEPRVTCIEKTAVNPSGIAKDIVDLSKRYDDVIVDAGGRDSVELRSGIACADVLIIPIQASQLDLWTLNTMEELVSNSLPYNPELKAYCVINRGSTNPSVSEVKEASGLMKELEIIKFSGVILRERISYRKMIPEGKGIEEMKPVDPKAKEEVEKLYNFIYDPK